MNIFVNMILLLLWLATNCSTQKQILTGNKVWFSCWVHQGNDLNDILIQRWFCIREQDVHTNSVVLKVGVQISVVKSLTLKGFPVFSFILFHPNFQCKFEDSFLDLKNLQFQTLLKKIRAESELSIGSISYTLLQTKINDLHKYVPTLMSSELLMRRKQRKNIIKKQNPNSQ